MRTTALYMVLYSKLDQEAVIESGQILVKSDKMAELFDEVVGEYLETLLEQHEEKLEELATRVKEKQDLIDSLLRQKGDLK